jgi:flavin reductase (DIM6/NTAB) family NADH-FMN oxidoreductase RutF
LTAFAAFVAALNHSMLIVTAAAGDERDGCLVGFHTQASIHPPRLLVCLSDKNRTYRLAREADVLVAHMVPADAPELAEIFGGETGDEVDKLSQVAWRPGPGGAPVLERCPNWVAGEVLERIDFGDHVGFLTEPIAGEADAEARGLRMSQAMRIEPGHEA